MGTDENYDELLKNTRVFNEKDFIDLDKKEVEDYLSYLGYPKLPSEVFEETVQGKNLLFLLLCKLFQDYNNLVNKKDKDKYSNKELDCHHLKLFVYLMLNLDKRERFSVYNSLLVKMINIENKNSKVDINYYKDSLESRLNLTSSLYFDSNGFELVTGSNQLVFSDNELNELVSVLNNYMYAFQYFYKLYGYNKSKTNGNSGNNEYELVKTILMMLSNQMLLLFKIIRYYNKSSNKKLLDNLLIFLYYFYKYKQFLNTEVECEFNNYNNKEYKNNILVIKKLNDQVMNVAKNPVKDNLLEFLDMGESQEVVDNQKHGGNVAKKLESKSNKNKNKVKRGEQEENYNNKELLERRFGLLLVLPKAVELIRDDIDMVEKILNKLMLFIKMNSNKENKKKKIELREILKTKFNDYYNGDNNENVQEYNKEDEEEIDRQHKQDESIYVECFYRVLLVVSDGSLLLNYNSNSLVLSLINNVLGFVFEQMFQYYDYINKNKYEYIEGLIDDYYKNNNEGNSNKDNSRDNKDKDIEDFYKEIMKYWWDVLVIISDMNLEFIDENVEKLFKLLRLDFKFFSNKKLKNKSLEMIYDIYNSEKNKENEQEYKGVVVACDILPSCNFISNLVMEYNNTNQLNTFFEYVQVNLDNNKEDDKREMDNEEEYQEEHSSKRKLEGEKVEDRKLKRVRFKSAPEYKYIEADNNKVDKEEYDYRYDMNYLNNYCMMRSISILNVNENEVIKILKTFEKLDKEVYNLIVIYLSKLKFSVKNLDKMTEEFLKFYRSLKFKDEVELNSLMLRLQVLVSVRKLLSFFDPINNYEDEGSTTCNEEDNNNNNKENNNNSKNSEENNNDKDKRNKRGKEDKNPKKEKVEVYNKLLEVVYDTYLYVNKNVEKILENGKNSIIVLNMVYHFKMINNEIDQGNNNKEYLDVDKILMKLINNKDKDDNNSNRNCDNYIYRFLLRNYRLFKNNDNVNEFLLKNLNMEVVRDNLYENLDRKLSLEYFKKYVSFSVKDSFESVLRNKCVKGNNCDILIKKLYMLLDNVIEMDNSEVIKCLLENINVVNKRIMNNKNKDDNNSNKREMMVSVLVMLLELLLYVLEYEMKIENNNCYNLIVGYQYMNLFDVLINMKRMLVNDNNERDQENNKYYMEKKKIFRMFVKYYYLFSVYIYKVYNNNREKLENTDVVSHKQLELINSLLNNYLDGLDNNKKLGDKNKEIEMKKWDIYFVYKYIRVMGSNSYNGVCEMIFKNNEILYNVIEWCVYFVDNQKQGGNVSKKLESKSNKNKVKVKRGEQHNNSNKVVEMIYNNMDRFMDNKYISNLVLCYLNIMSFNDSDDKFYMLYSIIMRVIEVLNYENKYLLRLYRNKDKDELNGFFKRLFDKDYEMYKSFIFSCIENIENDNNNKDKEKDKDRDNKDDNKNKNKNKNNNGDSVKYLLLLVVLINNYNNKEKDVELYNKLVRFVENGQKYINKYVPDLSKCENNLELLDMGVGEKVVDNQKLDIKKRKENLNKINDELILNYLMVNRLYNVDVNEVRDSIIGLGQNILCHLNRKDDRDNNTNAKEYNNDKENESRLIQILLKLVNMLVNNVTQNITVIVYFYIQFNHFILNESRYYNFKELVRFTTLVINSNNYKYVKGYVSVLMNILIKTYYYFVNPPDKDLDEVDLILMEEFGDKFKKSRLDSKNKDEKNKETLEQENKNNYKDKDKNLEWLKRNIIKYIMMCDNRVKNEIYKMSDDKIKMLFKTELSH